MLCMLEGGDITRYHTVPCLRPQSIAHHSWRMAAVLHTIWPDCRGELTKAALFHDVSERVTGDIPYNVKAAHAQLRMDLNAISTEEEKRLGIRFTLTDEEQQVLRWLDLYEGMLYCLDELGMGNRRVMASYHRYHELVGHTKLDKVYDARQKVMAGMVRQSAMLFNVMYPSGDDK